MERSRAGQAGAASKHLPSTARELERDDSRPPRSEQNEVVGEVLLRVPEGAVVARVDGQVAVVAPAALDLGLWPGAGMRRLLDLGHLPERIVGGPPGVA